MTKILPALLIAILMAACVPMPTTKRVWIEAPLDQSNIPPEARVRLELGDRIRAEMKDGTQFVLKVHQLTDDYLTGNDQKQRMYRLQFREMARLEVNRIAPDVEMVPLEIKFK